MKKPRTEKVSIKEEFLVPIDEVFPKLKDKNELVAAALRGARYKAEMTQAQLTQKINIAHGDLSKMKHGKRPIGKNMAQRIASILKIDYLIFI